MKAWPRAKTSWQTTSAIVSTALACAPAAAVRLSHDGHGQALIFPYYTVRATASGNPYVSLLSVTNQSTDAKALKLRVLEGKAGAEVFAINLYLASRDVWTAAIVAAGTGAGIFTRDGSCASPTIATSPTMPSRFRNGAYIGDLLGNGLDRTNEGFIEILEMGAIEAGSALALDITQSRDVSAPNASRPACANLPLSATPPTELRPPSGGIAGAISFVNVNEGTDYSADAVALAQWSDKAQWSEPAAARPTIADAEPPRSTMIDSTAESDRMVVSQWSRGADAISATIMADQVYADYSVEPRIGGRTDWVVTMPTKRFYTTSGSAEPPFLGNPATGPSSATYCEVQHLHNCGPRPHTPFDREGQASTVQICFPTGTAHEQLLCGAASVLTFTPNGGGTTTSNVLRSITTTNVPLNTGWLNGMATFAANPTRVVSNGPQFEFRQSPGLRAPAGATTIIDLHSGALLTGATVTYYGFPIVGFAVQSYANDTLVNGNGAVLSNYGANYSLKYRRRIEVTQ